MGNKLDINLELFINFGWILLQFEMNKGYYYPKVVLPNMGKGGG